MVVMPTEIGFLLERKGGVSLSPITARRSSEAVSTFIPLFPATFLLLKTLNRVEDETVRFEILISLTFNATGIGGSS
jgi:hypothetical protein